MLEGTEMPHTVKHDPVLAIVEVTFTGSVTGADLREATTKCSTLQKQTGATRFLVDGNQWDVIASFVDIYDLPAEQYLNEEVYRESRIAVVLPTSERSLYAAQFYETACQNRGWNAKVYPDRQSALDWLMSAVDSKKIEAGDG